MVAEVAVKVVVVAIVAVAAMVVVVVAVETAVMVTQTVLLMKQLGTICPGRNAKLLWRHVNVLEVRIVQM